MAQPDSHSEDQMRIAQDNTLSAVSGAPLAWYLHTAYAAGTAMQLWGRILPPTALPVPDNVPQFHDRTAAIQWFDREWSNVFAAIRTADKAGLDKVTWQLALVAEPAFRHGVPIDDQCMVATTGLDAARRDGAQQAEAELLGMQAEAERIAGHLDECAARYQESLTIFRAIGDHDGERITLNSLGVDLIDGRRFHQAAEQFERLRLLQNAAADIEGEGAALFNLAGAYVGMQRHNDAIDAANRSIDLGRAIGNRHVEFVAVAYLASAQQTTAMCRQH